MIDFEKLERINCQIDVWIDEEKYERVFNVLIQEKTWGEKFEAAFSNPTCTSGTDKEWQSLLTSNTHLPVEKVIIDDKEESLTATDEAWSVFLAAKSIRAKIQQKGTDCYFRRLDDVVAYLERHLPIIYQRKAEQEEAEKQLSPIKLAIIFLLEMAAAGETADQRSFSERARRMLKKYINQEGDNFAVFYELLARYNSGVGYFHERNYDKALSEFDYIIDKEIRNKRKSEDFFQHRLLNELIYQPAILYRADIQLKMQLAFHAVDTLKTRLQNPSKYKEMKADLIHAEAYQQMDQYDESLTYMKNIAEKLDIALSDTDLSVISATPDEICANIKSRLQNLMMAYYTDYLSNQIDNNKGIDDKWCEKIIKFLNKYRESTVYQKSNREGYFEQVAEIIGLMSNKENDLNANLIYSKFKTGILEAESNQAFLCPCKERGIDLRRLSSEHRDTFIKNIRKYYDLRSITDLKEIKEKEEFLEEEFLERIRKIEEDQYNREWRKWDIDLDLERNKQASADWGKKCLANCPDLGSLVKRKNGFADLLCCAGPSNDSSEKNLKAKDYETLMDNWDEHFLKHLNSPTVHDPPSYGIHFLGLQRWNSTSPAQGRSLGGGYLIYHTDKHGCVDLGIAVDPGFDFIRNLFHVGFSLADIDIVILSHAHVDHVRDFESMLGLLFELKSRDHKQQKLHAIMTFGVYDRLQYLIDSPGLREFVEPYIIDIEKDIDTNYLSNLKFEFTQGKGDKTGTGRKRFYPVIKDNGDRNEDKLFVIIKPTIAYHNDHSDRSDTYGFKITINDYASDTKPSFTIGYTSDTRWHGELIKDFEECNALLMHLGSLIERKKKKDEKGVGNKFIDYDKSEKCFKLVSQKNHPYLMGILHFLSEIKSNDKFKKNLLILLSEFGEEMRGKIRLDLINRLNVEYYGGAKNILPVDVGLDVLLTDVNSHGVWCVQCQKYVSLEEVDFETYGYDEALFYICKTCKKSTPQNVSQDNLRRLYEEGRPLRTLS